MTKIIPRQLHFSQMMKTPRPSPNLKRRDVSSLRVCDLRDELRGRGVKFSYRDLKSALIEKLEDCVDADDAVDSDATFFMATNTLGPPTIDGTQEEQFQLRQPSGDILGDNMKFVTPRTLDLSEKVKSLELSLANSQKEGGGLVSIFFLYQWGPRDENVHDCYHKFYIDYGYRPTSTLAESFISLFQWHNETMNIWSHLIGFVCTLVAVVKFAVDLYFLDNETYTAERLLLGGYITCASLCLLFSTLYHWFCCVSPEVSDSLLRIDLTGIALLIGSSYFPVSYFGFYCTPHLQVAYLGLSTVVLASALCMPWVDAMLWGVPARTILMVCLAGVGVVPFTHWLAVTPYFYIQNIAPGKVS